MRKIIIFRNIAKHYLVNTIIIIIKGFIERKINTNPLMHLSPRRESPGTDMGQYPKKRQPGYD